jgi:hypothetical protein
MLPGVEALLAGGQKALGLGALLPDLQLPGGRVVDEEDGRSARPVPAQRHQHLRGSGLFFTEFRIRIQLDPKLFVQIRIRTMQKNFKKLDYYNFVTY